MQADQLAQLRPAQQRRRRGASRFRLAGNHEGAQTLRPRKVCLQVRRHHLPLQGSHILERREMVRERRLVGAFLLLLSTRNIESKVCGLSCSHQRFANVFTLDGLQARHVLEYGNIFREECLVGAFLLTLHNTNQL